MNTPSQTLRVFLCHSSSDKLAVRALYQQLKAAGVEPWFDEEDLVAGQDWEHEIRRAVRAAHAILVCLSRDSVSKTGFIQKEIRIALDVADEQPEGTIFIIPLKLEECDVPDRLSRWQWINYVEPRGHERLLRALRVRATQLGVTLNPPRAPAGVSKQLIEALLSGNTKRVNAALIQLESLDSEAYVKRLLEIIADDRSS